MRTILCIPTLLALTLASGAALADKGHGAVDRLRARGDVLDKSYRTAPSHAAPQRSDRVAAPVRPMPDRGASRVTCSETGLDCPQRASRSGGAAEGAGQGLRATHAPSFLDKVLGSDRTTFNEAGEAQGMSGRAVKRAWSRSTPGAASAATTALSHQAQHARSGEQASANRMACNEAGECMMSSKKAKAQWSYSAVKAGTWQGPEAAPSAVAAPAADAPKTAQIAVGARLRERAVKIDAPKHDGQ